MQPQNNSTHQAPNQYNTNYDIHHTIGNTTQPTHEQNLHPNINTHHTYATEGHIQLGNEQTTQTNTNRNYQNHQMQMGFQPSYSNTNIAPSVGPSDPTTRQRRHTGNIRYNQNQRYQEPEISSLERTFISFV